MIRIVIQYQKYSFGLRTTFYYFAPNKNNTEIVVTPLLAWGGCKQPFASSSSSCNFAIIPLSHLLHFSWSAHFKTLNRLCFSRSLHKVLPFLNPCSLHILRPEGGGGGWLWYGCNTTVICMMKRIIYFLITSNYQEVQRCSVSGGITVYWVKCICSLNPAVIVHWENCDVVQHKQTNEDSIMISFFSFLMGNITF